MVDPVTGVKALAALGPKETGPEMTAAAMEGASAERRDLFRALVKPADGVAPAGVEARFNGSQDPQPVGKPPAMLEWLDTRRTDFTHSLDQLSENVKLAAGSSQDTMPLILQTQVELAKISLQVELSSHLGQKATQNFDTFFKNQS